MELETLTELVESNNLDSGRAAAAAALKEVGDVSEKFVSKNGDGYYFVKLTAREGNRVQYEFGEVMNQIRADNKIEEMITVEAGAEVEEESQPSDEKNQTSEK